MEETIQTGGQELSEKKAASSPESFETIDYVRELFLQGIEQEKRDKKKLRLMWLCAVFMGIMALALVCGVIMVRPYVEQVVSDVNAISTKVLAIDVDGLIGNVNQFLGDATVSINAVGDAAKTIEALDIDSLNAAITGLGEAVESLKKLDIATLNTAIANLNDTVTPMAKFFAAFR